MRHSIAHVPQGHCNDIQDLEVRKAIIIADIALSMYLSDIKALVIAGVEADIRETADLDPLDEPGLVNPEERRSFLKKWTKTPFPLDYNAGGFQSLVRAIARNKDAICLGLPG